MPPFNVPSDRCVAPTLDYSALTGGGLEGGGGAVVDLPDGPNMIQTHVSVGCRSYQLGPAEYTLRGDTLSKSGNPTLQPLKIFQFIIGELRFTFADESDDVHSLIFQTVALPVQLLPQHLLVPRLPLTLLLLVPRLLLTFLPLVPCLPLTLLPLVSRLLLLHLHHPQ